MHKTGESFYHFPSEAEAKTQIVARLREFTVQAEAGEFTGLMIFAERAQGDKSASEHLQTDLVSYYGGTVAAHVVPMFYEILQRVMAAWAGGMEATRAFLETGMVKGAELLNRTDPKKAGN